METQPSFVFDMETAKGGKKLAWKLHWSCEGLEDESKQGEDVATMLHTIRFWPEFHTIDRSKLGLREQVLFNALHEAKVQNRNQLYNGIDFVWGQIEAKFSIVPELAILDKDTFKNAIVTKLPAEYSTLIACQS